MTKNEFEKAVRSLFESHGYTKIKITRVGAFYGRFGGEMTLTILVQDKAPGSQAPSDAENTAPQSGSGI